MNSNIKRIYVFFVAIILFMFINKDAYAYTLEKLTKIGDGYYYINSDGNIYSSNDKDLLKRINDTYYFVDYNGRVYVRNIAGYDLVTDDSFSLLIEKKLVYENIKGVKLGAYFANKRYEPKEGRGLDLAPRDTSIYYNNPVNMKDINICLIGDSYAYNMAANNSYIEKYSLAPGYVISAIKNEVLPLVDFKDVKYCILFIGPNDLMNETDFIQFQKDIYYVCNYIAQRGAKPILMSYLGIGNYGNTDDVLVKNYDHIVQCAALAHNGIYIFVDDIDRAYGRELDDPVHPRKEFYKTAFKRVYNRIKDDYFK